MEKTFKKPVYFGSVLIIDDKEIDLYITKRILLKNKITLKVFTETSSNSALHFLNRTEIFPELIFLDFQMSEEDGLDFLESYQELPKEKRKNTRIIVLSAYVNYLEKRMEDIKIHPLVSGLLQKPFLVQNLTDIQNALLKN